MDDEVMGPNLLCSLKIDDDRLDRPSIKFRIPGSNIRQIREMEKEGKESRRFHQRPKMANLVLIEGCISPPPWVPGEELDGFAPSDLSPFDDF